MIPVDGDVMRAIASGFAGPEAARAQLPGNRLGLMI